MKKYSNPKMEYIEVSPLMQAVFDPSRYTDPDPGNGGQGPTAPARNW